jgi:hypothetical protein
MHNGKQMIIKQKNSESSHWYTKKGQSAYQVEAKNGEMRATTLRDARKLDLVPSVTTILGVAAKPALTHWLQTQVLLSALTLPREPNEPESDWLERVMADSKVQGRQAAERGTAIHGIIESYFEQTYLPEWPQYVRNVDQALNDTFGNQLWLSEKSFAHDLGYGGKIDLSAQNLVVDFKTKETALDKVEPYHEHEMQLAAYCVGLGYKLEECRAAIVFVNGTTNEVKLCEIPPDSLKSAWECFTHLLAFYKLKNNI